MAHQCPPLHWWAWSFGISGQRARKCLSDGVNAQLQSSISSSPAGWAGTEQAAWVHLSQMEPESYWRRTAKSWEVGKRLGEAEERNRGPCSTALSRILLSRWIAKSTSSSKNWASSLRASSSFMSSNGSFWKTPSRAAWTQSVTISIMQKVTANSKTDWPPWLRNRCWLTASLPLTGRSKTFHMCWEKTWKLELIVRSAEVEANAQAAALPERRLETNAIFETSVG